MTAEDLVKLIRQRYPMDRPDGYQSYVVLEQVPDGTGMHHNHWIDAVVFSLWASKGLSRIAFEIKVARSDFIHEMQNPMKHQWALECFHEFWFVAPQDVIQLSELPANIGWMCPHGTKLQVKKQAVRNPTPKLDDVLLAAFMRAASKEINKVSKVAIEEALESSDEYRTATVYRDAITRFISQRGNTSYLPTSTDEVVKWLDEATMDKELKQDREHLLDIAANFQRQVVSLLNVFLVIANKGLLARDELGRHIVNAFGGDDKESVETLRQHFKEPFSDSQRRYAELIELILNWDKELGVVPKK